MLNEWLQFTVEHGIDVTGFVVSSVVFDHLVGVHDIGSDLTAKSDVTF